MTHFADRLAAAVRSKGNPLCVGLDPRWESLPLELGLLTILDAKRNDIASTAAAYADAAFAGTALAGRVFPVWQADALTVNPYLGRDAVEPFLRSARRAGRGGFVLVRTSNPRAGQFQGLDCGGGA